MFGIRKIARITAAAAATSRSVVRLPAAAAAARGYSSSNKNQPHGEHARDHLIEYVTINNPAKRNALSMDVLKDLKNQFMEIQKSNSVEVHREGAPGKKRRTKVIILKSEGPVFSSGHDLQELRNGDTAFHTETFQLCADVMQLIRRVPQTVIAQVQGLAAAAGCQLVATCDLVIAAEDASFATPGVTIGLFCTTPGIALARAVPTKKAMEMLLTGLPITAKEAMEYGLVNEVVANEDLTKETLALARQIAKASYDTLALGKKAFYDQIQMKVEDAYVYGNQVMVDNLKLDDTKEGISAFLEKRPPQWKS
eukprot:GEZU01017791.1.p1 GENE.GEZU01017791.1~~GEZU01017791.1.p1  ORF type:complete len:310 (-),score=90.33 GEZU01017791.1:468-1397(-)